MLFVSFGFPNDEAFERVKPFISNVSKSISMLDIFPATLPSESNTVFPILSLMFLLFSAEDGILSNLIVMEIF